jgi:hypothetical protein
MIRDEWPFFVERWRDVESGNEYLDEYRLVFDFREGLLVGITQRVEGAGEFSWKLPLLQSVAGPSSPGYLPSIAFLARLSALLTCSSSTLLYISTFSESRSHPITPFLT